MIDSLDFDLEPFFDFDLSVACFDLTALVERFVSDHATGGVLDAAFRQ